VTKHTKRIIALVLALGAAASLLCTETCRSLFRPPVVFRDADVQVSESRSPASYLLTSPLHHSNTSYLNLTVCGKTYEHIDGVPPYHLKLNGPEAVVFVTHRPETATCTVHVVTLDDCGHTEINLGNANVAYGFGAPATSSLGSASVSWVDENVVDLRFSHPDQRRSGHWRLLLKSNTAEAVE
jgi:hypothetical protein